MTSDNNQEAKTETHKSKARTDQDKWANLLAVRTEFFTYIKSGFISFFLASDIVRK